jgi:uncharacterized protein (DUF305 family)
MLRTAPGPGPMDRAMYGRLASAPADQFDGMFNQDMIAAHKQTIALFKMEAGSGQNSQLRQFAMTTLPVLYRHLHVAEQLSPMQSTGMTSMGGMAATSQDRSAISAPVNGNPDYSADQLNARELTNGNPS